jgi:hypothetical protein
MKDFGCKPKKMVSNNQSSYVRILFENDFKGRLNGCRIICNSIVHLILWGHCCTSYYEKALSICPCGWGEK